MFVTVVPNRGSPPAVLLRESYREDGKVRSRTLVNHSAWPDEKVQTPRAALRGDKLVPAGEGGFEIRPSLPHGHVLVGLATARRIGLDRLLPQGAPQRRRDLVLALIIARLLDPAARLATARSPITATAGTIGPTGRNWSSSCCAPLTAVPSRSRYSTATPPIPPRWPARSPKGRFNLGGLHLKDRRTPAVWNAVLAA